MSRYPNRKPGPKLTHLDKQAIVAAVAAGAMQKTVAKEFGIAEESLSRMLRPIKKHQSLLNPLGNGASVRERVAGKAWQAVEAGVDSKRDPYARARIGIEVLKGVGELTSGVQVGGQVELKITWGSESEANVIDITPQDVVNDAE